MSSLPRFAVAGGLAALAGGASAAAAPSLPARLVTNWNAAGEPVGTLPKSQAIWLLPAVMIGLVALFAALPRIDPLRENIEAFRPAYDRFVVVVTLFLLVVHAGVLAFNLGYEFPFTSLIAAGIALLCYAIGDLLSTAERNWIIGIRTPWTLSDDAVWNETHRVGARLFKLTAVIGLLGLAAGEYAIYVVLVPLLVTTVGTVAYSYYVYERLAR